MQTINLFPSKAVPAAGTYVSEEFPTGPDANYIALQANLTYGSGGTTINVYLQTTFDEGATWCDIANLSFATASLRKISAINVAIAATAGTTPSDGALTANTVLNGFLGSAIRLKTVIVGTYAGSTFNATVYARR